MRKFTFAKRLRNALFLLGAGLSIHTAAFAQPTSTVTVGTGTTIGNYVPIYSCYGYTYSQQIFTAAQIVAANGGVMPPTNTITKIRFYVTALPTTTASSNDWTVYMGNTTTATFASSTSWIPVASLTQIFTGTVTFPTTVNNWMEITLATPFVWDGTSNIVIGVDENVTGYNCTVNWASTVMSGNQAIYYYSDLTNPNPSSPPSGTTSSTRANAQFEFLVPPNNAGVDSIFVPTFPFCSGPATVSARVHNYGSNIVNNVSVNWSIDGVLQTPIDITTPIDMENSTAGPDAYVTLDTIPFSYNVAKVIKAWTKLPNGVADTKPVNDTTTQSITATQQGIDFTITPQDTTICVGEDLVLDAGTQPFNPIYIWNTGALTQTITVDQAGVYSVKVQNTFGCYDIDTIMVSTHPSPLVNSIAIIDNGGGSFTFNIIGAQNINTYAWDFGDGTTASGPGPKTHVYTTPGEYTTTVTLTNDCGSVVTTRLIAVGGGTGLDELSALQKEMKVFPNPSNGLVTIANNNGIKMKSIAMFNIMGQEVYSAGSLNAEQHQINTAEFAAGIYTVTIETDKGKVSKKLEIMH